jgi:hypothetical protein
MTASGVAAKEQVECGAGGRPTHSGAMVTPASIPRSLN